jgi:membrane protein YdbS with pleckstrin-like domain
MNTQEKMLGVVGNGNDKKIVVSHVTIRQSIAVLLSRIIVIEIIAATGIVLFHTLLISTNITDVAANMYSDITLFNTPLYFLLVFLKTFLTVFVIIHWLNEYYEITPTSIIFRKGLIFKKEELTTLAHLGSMEIKQGILGRLFNFGTINLYNWASEKNISLYLIHNPMKYHSILQTILPAADKEKQVIREHLIEPEEL